MWDSDSGTRVVGACGVVVMALVAWGEPGGGSGHCLDYLKSATFPSAPETNTNATQNACAHVLLGAFA